ncbi:MAG: peptide/nickel transport system substrate-binding protein [Natronomonas sp.]|jgi:peptide/nickel transport system substrate-binding protein
MVSGLGAAAVAGLAGCQGDGGGEDTTTEPSDGGDMDGDDGGEETSPKPDLKKLTFAQSKSPIEFDPIVANDVPSVEVIDRFVEGLYAYDEETGIVPNMAKGEPEVSNGGKTYTVEIKSDPQPKFHNGEPVTAEDVKYSFLAPVEEETENAAELNMIDNINVVDDRTLEFNLKYPYGPFMTTLTWYVVPKDYREEVGKDTFNTEKPMGSGPFEFAGWSEGSYARVTRYDDYWGSPKSKLSEIEFVPVKEPTTRVTTLKNKENDIVKTIPPKQYPVVEGMGDAKVQEVPGIGYFYLAFNCNEGPTTDPKVREAVDYTFSMDRAVQNYVEPSGLRQYAPTPKPVSETWDFPLDEWKKIPHDKNIDKAKQLFEEAGVKKSYNWNIIVPPDDKREQIGISVSNGLKEAGYENVSVQRLNWGAFLDKYVSGNENDYNMYTLGWSGTPDPDAFTYYLLGRTEDTLGVTNGTFWGNNSEKGKKAAQQILDARKTADHEERRELYIDAITTALEQRAHIPSYNLKNSFGVQNYVKDFLAHPVDSFHITSDHNNTYIEK